ncbi:MAG: HD domain-containing protein [Deltaproteobacteria bacterium]|nr:HD domain-containing protein [Deltaproteobacteria bacterium]
MKLRIKLPLIYILLIASLGVVFILFTSKLAEDHIREANNEHFESLSKAFALNSANAIILRDYAALRWFVDNISKGEHVIYSIILDENSSVLAHTEPEFEGKMPDDPVSVKAAIATNFLMQTVGSDAIDVTAPLMIAGKKWGAVRIGFSLTDMQAKVARAKNLVLFAGLIAMFLGGAAAVFIAGKFTDPIHKLHRGTEIIGEGNLDYRINISTGDEIEQLSTAFNKMTENLKKNYHTIERAKKEWEATFDAISDPLFIHDKEFKIIRCNRAYSKAAGTFHEIIGRPYYEVFPKMDGAMKGCLKVLEMQEEGEEEISLPAIDKIYNTKFYLVRDAYGKYLYSLHILEDITEARKADEHLHELFMAAMVSLSSAIEAKSPWTKGHSERVTEYAIRIGRTMGLPDDELERLSIAGLLHDIGKIGIYDGILDKTGPLTDDEYEIVKRHPGKGADVLSPIKQLAGIIPWIRGHHESYDGKGYPDGLKGDEIPLQARILSVADAFDSMIAERPYRETPGKEMAIEELKRFSGIQFDPKVVEAFLRTL